MKKLYIIVASVISIGATNLSNAQTTTVTFDDLTLNAESHYDGSDGSGGFTSGGVFFENTYDTQFSYWSGGFIYSNTSDVTTAGYTNDFSAFTGAGASSANYGVNYGGNIDFTAETTVSSITLTNSTYAALSMLNGDSFGKQFGDSTDANGDLDGTNGEDWFRLLIVGRDAASNVTDTVIFYLADYRFANDQQDYIVDTWEVVDLSSLGSVRYLEFTLESSDEGQWGINTPAYFALDNLVYGTLAVNENELTQVTVSPNPAMDKVTFSGMTGELTISSTVGQVVYQGSLDGNSSVDLSTWEAGSYFYQLSNNSGTATGIVIKK